MSKRISKPGVKSQYLWAGLLLLLLPLLAALQYRWLGQLSESEQKQMLAGLRTAALRFSEEFDHEITIAYAVFLPDFSAPMTSTTEQLSQAFSHWQTASRYPQLIRSVYQVRLTSEHQLQLARFDPATQQLVATDWPVEMANLQQKMAAQSQQLEALRKQAGSGMALSMPAQRPMMIEAELPALLIPQPEMKLLGQHQFSVAMPISFLMIVLHREYITQEFLPTLAKRHFGEGAQHSYELTINNSATQQLLFSSSSQPLSASNADVSGSFFRLQAAELRERVRQRLQYKNAASSASESPGMLVPPIMPLMGMWAAAEQSDGPWQFHLRHQSGSLAAAVAQARRRNLGLSFTILVVLTASVVLLVQSTRRARRLAQQQMDFVAGVSHELRTPITVIDSAAHNLAKGVTRNPEQMQKYGRMIQRQTRQLHEMVEQVLEFAGIQSGRNLYELQPVQLNLLLEEFAQANQSWLAERGFQLQLNLAPDLPLVQADAAALRRALQNLLNNAQKYSGESRWIGLQASLDDSRQPAQVMISVSDRGRGIAAQDLPHIFAPFYRSSEVKAAQIHGNGLGLSLVQNIVRAHRGTIRVESNVGTGSTFTIRLPLAELASAQTTAQPAPVLTEVEGQ